MMLQNHHFVADHLAAVILELLFFAVRLLLLHFMDDDCAIVLCCDDRSLTVNMLMLLKVLRPKVFLVERLEDFLFFFDLGSRGFMQCFAGGLFLRH